MGFEWLANLKVICEIKRDTCHSRLGWTKASYLVDDLDDDVVEDPCTLSNVQSSKLACLFGGRDNLRLHLLGEIERVDVFRTCVRQSATKTARDIDKAHQDSLTDEQQ